MRGRAPRYILSLASRNTLAPTSGKYLVKVSSVGRSSEDSGQTSLLPTTSRPAHTKGEHLHIAWGSIHRAPADHFTIPIALVSCFLNPNFHFTPTIHLVVFAKQQTSTSSDQSINTSRLNNNVPLSLSQVWCRHLGWEILRFMRCSMFL